MLERVLPVCFGIQDIWVGHLDLECRHDLDCHTSKIRSKTKTISMEICGGLISYPEIPEEKVDQSILPWLLVDVRMTGTENASSRLIKTIQKIL